MHLLSQMIGGEVRCPDAHGVGHLADLTVQLGERAGPQLVARLLVRRHQEPDVLVPWHAVERLQHDGSLILGAANLRRYAIASTVDELGSDEILLSRDVLDTQIVDVVGQRLARVADVVLARTSDGRLELVGVEVGFGGVLRRLGLHRLAAGAGEDVVAWTDLHLTSERGHAVQLATPRSAVHHLDARALAALVSRLDIESAAQVLAASQPIVAAAVVQATHPAVGERVLRALPDTAATEIVSAMPAEHARRWRVRLAHSPTLLGRRFLRSRVWPRRRPGPTL